MAAINMLAIEWSRIEDLDPTICFAFSFVTSIIHYSSLELAPLYISKNPVQSIKQDIATVGLSLWLTC